MFTRVEKCTQQAWLTKCRKFLEIFCGRRRLVDIFFSRKIEEKKIQKTSIRVTIKPGGRGAGIENSLNIRNLRGGDVWFQFYFADREYNSLPLRKEFETDTTDKRAVVSQLAKSATIFS